MLLIKFFKYVLSKPIDEKNFKKQKKTFKVPNNIYPKSENEELRDRLKSSDPPSFKFVFNPFFLRNSF